ncbi:unnamed protein product [Bemisia tabaci]|uniref:Uncharacterized protein n=1 Tax=Bemisia tabaci TaxID=7038 RepID=A0A9P0A6Y0_BEMTA|nr:unnamed protein product [Bemisia tabaci]
MSENSTPQPLTPFLKETSSLYQDIPAGWPSTQEEDTMDRMLKENGLPMTPVLQDDSFSSPKSLEDGSYLNEIFERKSPLGLSNKRQFRRPAQSKGNARSSRTSAAFQTVEGISDSDLSTNSTVSNPRPKSFYVKTRSKSVAINATLGDEGMSESASDSSVSSAACPSNEIETFGLRHSSKTRSKSFHPKTGGKAFPINATLGDEELSDSSLTQSSAVKTETQPKVSFHPKKKTNTKQHECSIGEESMSDVTMTPSSTDKIKAQPKPSFHPMKKTNTQQYECSLGEESMSDVTITPSSSDKSKKRPESSFHPMKRTNTQQYECSLGEEDVSLGEGETVLTAVSPTAEEKREKRVSPRRNLKRKSTSPVQEPSIENSFSSYPSQSLPQKSGTPNSSKKKRTEKMEKESSVQQNISNMHASEALSPKTVDNSKTHSKSSAHPKRRSNSQQHNCSLGEEGMSDVSFAQLSLDCSTRHAVSSFHPKKKTKALQVECTLGDETNDEFNGSINELSNSERSTKSSQKNVSINSPRFSSRKSPVITVASDKSPKNRNSFCDESSAVTSRESAICSNTDRTFIKNNSNFEEQIQNSKNLSKQSSQKDVNSPRSSPRNSSVITVVNDKIPQKESSFYDELSADSVTEVAVNTSAKSSFSQSSFDRSTRHAVSSFHPKKKTKALQVECTLGDETNDETDGSINELSISERSTRSSQKNVSVNSPRFSSRKSPVITVASDKSPKNRNSFCDESSAVTSRESAICSNADCTFIKNNSNFEEQIQNSKNLSKQSSQKDVNSPRSSPRNSSVKTVVNDQIPENDNSIHDVISADSVAEVAVNTSTNRTFTKADNSICRNQPVKNHGTSLEYETSLDYTAATPYKGEESEDECSIFDNSITYVASGLKAAASFNTSLINGSLSSYSVSKLNRQTCPNESFVEEKRTSHLNSSGKTKKRVSNCTSHRTDCGTEAEDYSTLADFSMFASNDMEDASYESHSDVSRRDMQSVVEEPMRLHITEDALACSSNSLAPEISIKNASLSDRSIILSGNVTDNSKKLRRSLRSSKNLSRTEQGPSVANESGLSEEASMKKSESRNVSSSAGFLTGDGDIEDSAGTVYDSTQWSNNGSKCSNPAPSFNETNDGHTSLHNELNGSAYSDVSHNSEKRRRSQRSSKNVSETDSKPAITNEAKLSKEASIKTSESRNEGSVAGFTAGNEDIKDGAESVEDSAQWSNDDSRYFDHPNPALPFNECNDEHVSLHDGSYESANSANFNSINATAGPQHGPSRISIGTNMNDFFAKPLHPVNKRLERFSSTSLTKSNDSISLLSKCMQKQKKTSPKNNKASCGRTLRDRDDGFPKYAAPKLARPAYWVTNRLYSFLEEKLYPEHGIYSKRVAEKFIQFLQEKCKKLMKTSDTELEDKIISEIQDIMVKLRITNSDFMFHYFCQEFLPDEISNKIVPSLLPYSESCSRPNYDFANLFTKFF